MRLKQDIERKIRSKEAEIAQYEAELSELQRQIEMARAYIQGLKDILPKVAKQTKGPQGTHDNELRPGSAADKARKAIKRIGQPLHIGQLVVLMGKENTKKNRLSLAGTLARCVREKIVFTRPAPNTFGLLEFEEQELAEEVPEDFGK